MYVISFLLIAIGVAWVIWNCMHQGKEEEAELNKRKSMEEEPCCEYMDLRMPEKHEQN